VDNHAFSVLAAENASLRAQLAAASDRYARAVADADEVRGRLVAELAEARGKALEEAVVTFPGEVVEILDDDKAPEMRVLVVVTFKFCFW
jgi:molecular chaperone GrpE (heat shock protein)